MTKSSEIKLLSCKDVSEKYDAAPTEQIFMVEYIKNDEVSTKIIRYDYRTGLSADPETRFIQEECLKLNIISRYGF
jgi:hypothetical protein